MNEGYGKHNPFPLELKGPPKDTMASHYLHSGVITVAADNENV